MAGERTDEKTERITDEKTESVGRARLRALLLRADKLLKRSPILYYSDVFAERLQEIRPSEHDTQLYTHWQVHMYRVKSRPVMLKLKEKVMESIIEILKYRNVERCELKWAFGEPKLRFILDGKWGHAKININSKGILGYDINIRGDGIFVDLFNKKVGYNYKVSLSTGLYDRIYNVFGTDNIAELYVVLDKLKNGCKKGEDPIQCVKRKIYEIGRDLGFEVTISD